MAQAKSQGLYGQAIEPTRVSSDQTKGRMRQHRWKHGCIMQWNRDCRYRSNAYGQTTRYLCDQRSCWHCLGNSRVSGTCQTNTCGKRYIGVAVLLDTISSICCLILMKKIAIKRCIGTICGSMRARIGLKAESRCRRIRGRKPTNRYSITRASSLRLLAWNRAARSVTAT